MRLGKPCLTLTDGPFVAASREVEALSDAFALVPAGATRDQAREALRAAAKTLKNREEGASRAAAPARKRATADAEVAAEAVRAAAAAAAEAARVAAVEAARAAAAEAGRAAAQRQLVVGGGGALAPVGGLAGPLMMTNEQFDRLLGVYQTTAGGLQQQMQQQQHQQQHQQQEQQQTAARVAAIEAQLGNVTRLLEESLRRGSGGEGGGPSGATKVDPQ
ncbi:MAG: Dual-specificity kinase, spindle pole body (SPB) duplication and spindle checkpoint function [Watsoniomyces obsoletus]|nr:MAG: Dual-specificity kinase, spindle pole body (SPB) duplication and spindle checkpoint function [Watsoniomyces obsoletus]